MCKSGTWNALYTVRSQTTWSYIRSQAAIQPLYTCGRLYACYTYICMRLCLRACIIPAYYSRSGSSRAAQSVVGNNFSFGFAFAELI